MNVPGPVASALGEEEVAAHVPLGGDDALYVTGTRTLVYKGDGLLSDESVAAFPHDAERVAVVEGRRKTKIALEYVDGERSFAVPQSRVEEALHPVLAGVLNAAGVTGPGETVTRTYRFSELTLVVTSERVVKHVGEAVWDDEFEEFEYADVTGVGVEEGSVASQLVIETTTRPQRIKAPNDQVRDVRARIEDALLAYHEVGSYEEFEALVADGEDVETGGGDASASFESDLDPIDLSGGDDAEPATEESAAEASAASTAGGGAAEPGSADASADAAASVDVTGQSDATDATEATESTEATDATEAASGEAATATASESSDGAGFEEFESAVSAGEPADASADADALEDRLRALQATVERQREILDEQQALVEALAAELDQRD
jgi:hypothetical protein